MKAQTHYNKGFYEVAMEIPATIEVGSKEWYNEARKLGYKYSFRWVNSTNNWEFFATTQARAVQGAIELYWQERGGTLTDAKRFYGEFVDVRDIKQLVAEWD